ncbi:MAG: tRNA (N6-threonylcarbamoyladenosine(37)-N6)-methyltransferase TrmO [Methylobacterium sp.]|nr:tRNA (N6-threonylcarbamoyladenosine(37)-N6)-methyltransferase TrmO [Methylobacterium sp.]MCA3646651.1 tRNA (N6-threonylcarbamoyladenosine(37)-N6)-methyltransferase TrmO [Methylobacterium sp.]MCA3652571.1 tRNA (N6-threonylcarbamoyladenosine(37)-N6)-methyltransferase TrmO [Methylobacterium sp.]MCA4922567.1 tRNA (N6-threonylcarbamoyladenosine(37)-N6)-methyltransferase TrmO [Methylobacterium sp.]
MKHHDATRPGEIEAPLPDRTDARVVFIGTIRTPFLSRDECPRQGKAEGPLCRIELHDPWKPALKGIERFGRIEVLYWMHQARRDLILQSPKANGETFGTFALRSPVRPNPIATSMVELVAVEDGVLVVRGLDCVDGTPLVDLKPDRCAYTPVAPPNPGELTEAS